MSEFLISKLEELIHLVRSGNTPTDADYAEFGRQCAAVGRMVLKGNGPYPDFCSMVRCTGDNANWTDLQHAFFKAWKRVK